MEFFMHRWQEQTYALNAVDGPAGIYEKRRSDVDVPHRVVVNGILELPFGRGRKFDRMDLAVQPDQPRVDRLHVRALSAQREALDQQARRDAA